jgi:translocation and assembly module TamB
MQGAASGAGGDAGRAADRRRVTAARLLGWTVATLLALLLLGLGTLYAALHTEKGTHYAWQAAVRLAGGRLSGAHEGGTIERGVRLSQVRWHDGGNDIRVSRIEGQWQLTRSPWRFTVDFLHVGAVDVRLAPSPDKPAQKLQLPARLTLPVQLDLRRVRLDRLVLRQAVGAPTEFTDLALALASDGRHHRLSLDSLGTAFGELNGHFALDGLRPFPVRADAGFSGKIDKQAVRVGARAAGTLEALGVDVDASGMQLSARAHVDATPFGEVPLRAATLAADHIDPRTVSPGAPAADLTIRANLRPLPARPGAPLTVGGPVTVVNAKPGAPAAGRLPLARASATITLDAGLQAIRDLDVRLIGQGVITGGGGVRQGVGRFDLRVAGLDLHVFSPVLRATSLSGPVTVVLNGGNQGFKVDVADARQKIAAQAAFSLGATQIGIDSVRLSAGGGRAQMHGILKKDAGSSYMLQAALSGFDPFSLLAGPAAAPPPGRSAPGRAPAPPKAPGGAPLAARVTGTFKASGALAPQLTSQLDFALRDSMYNGLPLSGVGKLRLAGNRLLPSQANLSVAGNAVNLSGGFGGTGDRLVFRVDAPYLDRLGFGLAGAITANGDITGTFAHPSVVASYTASNVTAGGVRIGFAQGRAEMRDGPQGTLALSVDGRDIGAPGVTLNTLSATVAGVRSSHTANAHAVGQFRGQPVDVTLDARGKLSDTPAGTAWNGTITQLLNRGTPAIALAAPVTLGVAPQRLTLGPATINVEGAVLALGNLSYDHGRVRSAGTLSRLDLNRMLELVRTFTGKAPAAHTDLVFEGGWDFALADTASGYAQLRRVSGDVTVDAGRGLVPLGVSALNVRLDFAQGAVARVNATATAARLGNLTADVQTRLVLHDGVLGVSDTAALSGRIDAAVPTLRTTGALLGPQYILDGRLALALTLAGEVGRPELSGSLSGDGLSATMVDQGVTLKDGVVRVALNRNLVEFQQVEFHGASGVLRMTGRVELDGENPDVSAQIVADKLELFAAPDRQLSLSGSASVVNGAPAGGMAVDGKFTVDHALFDLPEAAAPRLGDDVEIVRTGGDMVPGAAKVTANANKPAGPFAPRANIDIDLGENFRFRGVGADLGLRGALTVMSAPNVPLRAVGNVRVIEGSTYEAFGRKLGIENGYFTFNGPVANPGVNILAMRRNQEVEAGVLVTGTVQTPTAKLVSEPNVPDNEKLSWLLFGHGTETGTDIGQQNTMNAALALIGNVGGKRIAQTIGLDEFSIGQSEVGLTENQVVSVAKALNERFVLGYEQALGTAASVFKITWNVTRHWALTVHSGTINGVDLMYNQRFD